MADRRRRVAGAAGREGAPDARRPRPTRAGRGRSGGGGALQLQVSLEVDPTVFQEDGLRQAGATLVRRHHKGWLSVRVPADRLQDLRALPGVESAAPVLACEDRLGELQPPPEWRTLAQAACDGVLQARLEVGQVGGRPVLLRQTLETTDRCFVRSHRTAAQDIAVLARAADGATRVLCRHSDGLRDLSVRGMHDWKAGETHAAAMWVGHLPPGEYAVRAGVDGWVRVKGRPVPFVYESALRLG